MIRPCIHSPYHFPLIVKPKLMLSLGSTYKNCIFSGTFKKALTPTPYDIIQLIFKNLNLGMVCYRTMIEIFCPHFLNNNKKIENLCVATPLSYPLNMKDRFISICYYFITFEVNYFLCFF